MSEVQQAMPMALRINFGIALLLHGLLTSADLKLAGKSK